MSRPFNDDRKAVQYIEGELARAMLPGWVFWQRVQNRHQDTPGQDVALCDREWKICREDKREGLPMEFYALRITEDLRLIYITFGNTDVGPGGVHDFIPKAVVIETADLEHWGLAKMVTHLLSHPETYPINTYGYS